MRYRRRTLRVLPFSVSARTNASHVHRQGSLPQFLLPWRYSPLTLTFPRFGFAEMSVNMCGCGSSGVPELLSPAPSVCRLRFAAAFFRLGLRLGLGLAAALPSALRLQVRPRLSPCGWSSSPVFQQPLPVRPLPCGSSSSRPFRLRLPWRSFWLRSSSPAFRPYPPRPCGCLGGHLEVQGAHGRQEVMVMLCSKPCSGLWVRTLLLCTAPEPPNSSSSLFSTSL